MQLHKITLPEVLSGLPDVVPFDSQNVGQDDLFICALGFEERALQFPRELTRANYRANHALYLTYDTNITDNERNLPDLRTSLLKLSSQQSMLNVDDTKFIASFSDLMDSLCSEVGTPRVTLDISAGANRLILSCMHVLLNHNVMLHLLYSEAAIYFPTQDEYLQSKQLGEVAEISPEHGVDDIVVSPIHAGEHLDPLPEAVILFPSFKKDRSISVINEVDESLVFDPGEKVIWLLGEPRLPGDQWRMQAMREINEIAGGAPQFPVSTFEYKATLRILDSLHDKLSQNFNITVSMIGSKLQAVGASLFLYQHPGVRALIAKPVEYHARHYSSGCKAMWSINFGATQDLRLKLDSVGGLVLTSLQKVDES